MPYRFHSGKNMFQYYPCISYYNSLHTKAYVVGDIGYENYDEDEDEDKKKEIPSLTYYNRLYTESYAKYICDFLDLIRV